jgi:hypothetical protein
MQQDNLTASWLERLMLERNYGISGSYRIVLSDRGKALLVDLSRPEVSGDCEQVWIAKNWPELGQVQVYCIGLLHALAFLAQVFRENNRFRQFAHGAAQSPAFVSQTEIRFFFRQTVARLQNAFRSFDKLTRLELPPHFGRLFDQAGIFFG